MKWRVVAVGTPKLEYARIGIEEYLARLRKLTAVDAVWVKQTPKVEEALAARTKGTLRLVLDERGEQFTSRGFAARIGEWEQSGVRTVSLVIGGAGGHSEEFRKAADCLWSLGKITLQHELALLVALEQVYRAYSINSGAPYHRD